jgi:PIN domain nuclease of toxin-antitoxin system
LLPRFLLDTHVAVRWLVEPKRLSREQFRLLEAAVQRSEPVALSAVSLLEIAILASEGKLKLKAKLAEFFDDIQASPIFRLLPLTFEVASEIASLGNNLRDPADRTIVATARVRRLRLLTSDQRIIESKLAPTVE